MLHVIVGLDIDHWLLSFAFPFRVPCGSLACPQQVEALIDYVVTEPPEDSEGKVKIIYPYKSSEVIFHPHPIRTLELC